MSTFYWCWIYVIFLLFIIFFATKKLLYTQIFLCALSIFEMKTVVNRGLDYTMIDAPRTPFEYIEKVDDVIEPYRDYLTKDTYVYLAMPDQDTEGYYLFEQRGLPAILSGPKQISTYKNSLGQVERLDFTISFRDKLDATSDRQYYLIASPEMFTDVMREYFDYVFIVDPDEEFKRAYSMLFDDGMTIGKLYKITNEEIPMKAVEPNV